MDSCLKCKHYSVAHSSTEWPDWKSSCNRDEQLFFLLAQTQLWCVNNIFEYVLSLVHFFKFYIVGMKKLVQIFFFAELDL